MPVQSAAEMLMGCWEGTGDGSFPTIDGFSYRERFSIVGGDDPAVLRYDISTWRATPEGEVPSHVEAGFITFGAAGDVSILNAQGADRVEVLSGSYAVDDGGLAVEVVSTALAHDERMVSSWRTIRVFGDELVYEMGMQTTAVESGAKHLSARLRRAKPR